MAGFFNHFSAKQETPESRIENARARSKALFKKGDLDNARLVAREGTAIAVESYGKNSLEHAIGLNEEAFLDCVLRRYDVATELCIQAVGIYTAAKPNKVPFFIAPLGQLALKIAESDPAAGRDILGVVLRVLEASNLKKDELYGVLENVRRKL